MFQREALDVPEVQRGWTTKDEIEFIKELGMKRYMGNIALPLSIPERIKLLEGYRQGLSRRRRWGLLDPEAVKKAVDEQLYLLIGESQAFDPIHSLAPGRTSV